MSKRLFEILKSKVSCFGQIPHDPAGKRITCPGWIKHFLQRISWERKKVLFVKEKRSMFSFFKNNDARTHVLNFPPCFNEIGFSRKQSGFPVINHNHIHPL